MIKKLLFLLTFLPLTTFAQFSDDFEDGDISNWTQSTSGRWDASTISPLNGSYSLHHVFDNTIDSHDQISIEFPSFDLSTQNVSWRFLIKYTYNPYSTNNWSVFLMSDVDANQMHPAGTANGYALGVDYTGTDDLIKIWKITAGIATVVVATSINWNDVGTTNAPAIEVVRNSSGDWIVNYNLSGNFNSLTNIGTGTDATYTSANYFGLYYKYSSGQDMKLWIDDIYIGPEIIDIEPPQVINIEVIDSKTLRVDYSETVDSTIAVDVTNYIVDKSIGNPDSISINDLDNAVDLFFTESFINGEYFNITIQNMEDLKGNIMSDTIVNFLYFVPRSYDIVINEIMADPDPVVYLPDYEYIEIFNTTAYNISLSEWTLAVGSTIRTLPSYTIEPNAYLILCSDEAYSLISVYGNTMVVSGFPSLTNSGQTINLRNKESKVISSVSYSDSWYKNGMKADGGWSLEQIDPYNPCGGEFNWLASENSNGGTPGQQNSVFGNNPDNNAPELLRIGFVNDTTIQVYFNESIDSISAMQLINYEVDNSVGYPESISLIGPTYQSVLLNFNHQFLSSIIYALEITGGITDCTGNEIGTKNSAPFSKPVSPETNDIVINEILFNPRSEGFDFIELYNRSQKTIDLNDLRITAFDDVLGEYSSVNDISESSYLIMPGEYLVLTEDPLDVQNQYYTPNSYGFVELSSMPSYNDDAGRAILLDNYGNTIDNMEYTDDMHFALLSTTDGVSLERLNFDRPTNDISNWHSASELVEFATPAYENSQFKESADTEDKIKVDPEVFSPDNDGLEDVVDIQLLFDESGFVANIKIFDSRGRQVKLLANNLLLGIENTITWDGLTDANQKTPNGIYIIYIEVFDLKGNVKDYRKPVVVAEKY